MAAPAATVIAASGAAVRDATASAPPTDASPRSHRDVDILRSLARRIHPQDAGAHNNLGVVFFQKGLYAEAIEAFDHALELDPRMQTAERNLQIAYFSTGHFEQLVTELRQRLDADEGDLDARRRLARAYLHGGDPAAAIAQWQRILVVAPDDVDVHLQLARAERRRGGLDAALAHLRRAAALDTSARIHLEIGDVLYSRGLSEEAREELERAVTLDHSLASGYHLLAFVYGDLGLMANAEEAASRAAELNPSFVKTETNLSLDRHNSARYKELVGERQAQPEVLEATLAHYTLGLAFRQKGLFDEAAREFALALERGEDRLLVRQAVGELLLLRGMAEEAYRLYGELVEEQPGSPKLWNERGVAAHQRGRLEDAEQLYRKALELDGMYALAWNNLGVVLHHEDRSEDAEQAFRSALTCGRAPADVWRNLGLMLARQGRRSPAQEAYRRALELEPGSAAAWTGLGAVLMENGRPAEARAAFVRAVEADPKLAEARYQLAFALSALGDYRGALRETRLALELDPYYPAPRHRLLIDLQFEDGEVLAPELGAPEHVQAGSQLPEFDLQPEMLGDFFADIRTPAPGVPGMPPRPARPEPEQPAEEVPFPWDADGTLPDLSAIRPAQGAPEPSDRAEEALDAAWHALAGGRVELAATEAQRAADAGADRRDLLLVHAEIFLRQGLAGEALERFNQVLEDPGAGSATAERFDDRRRRALLGRARSLLVLGRVPAARESAEKLCELAPEHGPALRVLGETLVRSGAYVRAVETLERARDFLVDDAGLLIELGSAYAGCDDDAAAEAALRGALRLDGAAVAAHVALGRLYRHTGRWDAAAQEFRAALGVLPSYGDAALPLAELELERGDATAAVAALVDLLTVDPYHLEALVQLGATLAAVDRVAEAHTAYERVLRFDPGNEAAARGLASLAGTPHTGAY
jgi:cellulose synthase operon protein C